MTSRRRFICSCSAIAVSAASAPTLAILRRDVSLVKPGFNTFAALLNSPFVAASQSLELVEVAGAREAFAVLFRGDSTKPLPQDTYRFEHGRIGRFDLFIVPVGRSDQGHCYYEAVFNRTPTPTNEFYG